MTPIVKKNVMIKGIILSLFIIPFILLLHQEGYDLVHMGMFFVFLLSLTFLLSYNTEILLKTLPVSIFFFYLTVSYYIKFHLFALFGKPAAELQMKTLLPFYVSNPRVLLESYYMMLSSFSLFCITAFYLVKNQRGREPKALVHSKGLSAGERTHLYLIGYIGTVLYAIVAIISWKYRVTVMGQPMIVLPFRLAGLLFYYRWIAFSIIVTSMIYVCLRNNDKNKCLFFLGIFALYCLSETLIRATRGALFLSLFQILLVYYFAGKLDGRVRNYLLVFVLLGFVLFQFITAYRFAGGRELDIVALWDAQEQISSGDSVSDIFVSGLTGVFFRLSGIETLMIMVGKGVQPLGLKALTALNPFGELNIGAYCSYAIFDIPLNIGYQRGPGFLGFFYLVGGWPLAVIGPSIFLILIWKAWLRIFRLKFFLMPVAQSIMLSYALVAAMGGIFDYMAKYPLVVAIATFGLLNSAMPTGKAVMAPGRVKVGN